MSVEQLASALLKQLLPGEMMQHHQQAEEHSRTRHREISNESGFDQRKKMQDRHRHDDHRTKRTPHYERQNKKRFIKRKVRQPV